MPMSKGKGKTTETNKKIGNKKWTLYLNKKDFKKVDFRFPESIDILNR